MDTGKQKTANSRKRSDWTAVMVDAVERQITSGLCCTDRSGKYLSLKTRKVGQHIRMHMSEYCLWKKLPM